MIQPAWRIPRSSVGLAALICLGMSTQILFQRGVYSGWPAGAIATAWLRLCAELGIIATAILAVLYLAGRCSVRQSWLSALLYALALLAGALVGEWLVLWLQWGTVPAVDFEALLPRAVRWLPIGALAGAILVMRERMRRVDAELRDTELTRLRLEQQRVAVQLQVLQSQIEPHFLFNTLATIRRLQQTDPVRGRETLAGFIHYLRSALPEMRAVETTLGREVALIRAYLDVLKVRMGARLEYSIDVPADLAGAHIPPLALATLVENAVKHGLSNLPEGGHLGIVARRDGDLLLVRVADSGVGLTAQGGAGMGLANLRVRLRGLYGEAGRLELASNHPRGVAVTLQVPVRHEHGDR